MIDSAADLQLAGHYTAVSTGEMDAASRVIERLQGPFHARQRVRDSVGTVCIRAALCGTVAVSTFTFGRAVDIVPTGMANALLVTTAIHGTAAISTRDGRFQAQVGDTLITHEEDAPTFGYAPDTAVLKLRFDRRRLQQLGARMYGIDAGRPIYFDTAMTAPGVAPRWLSLMRYLLETLNGAVTVSAQELASMEEHVMLTLLSIQPHNYRLPPPDSRRALVLRQFRAATDYIDRHISTAIALADIADAAHCSMRSLARAFESVGEIPPMQYVHRVRLERIKAELENAGSVRRTIADVAFQWGYSHLGEFNRKYRATFGETPSATRQSLLAGNRHLSGAHA